MDTDGRPKAAPCGEGWSANLRPPPLLLIFDVPEERRGGDVVERASELAHELARSVAQLRERCSSLHVVVEGDPVLRTTLSLAWRTIASRCCRTLPIRIHASVADAVAEFLARDIDLHATDGEGVTVVP